MQILNLNKIFKKYIGYKTCIFQQYFQSVNMSDSDFVDVEGDEESFSRKKVLTCLVYKY